MRFDHGEGYIIVRRGAVILLHGADPRLEGKPSSITDAKGRPLADLIADALATNNQDVVSYLFPKPGQSKPQLKISYVARFAPWDVAFFSGAYIDDLNAALHASLWRLAEIGAIIADNSLHLLFDLDEATAARFRPVVERLSHRAA